MTSFCTLNCEKCIAYIPYFKKRKHEPLDKLKKDIDTLFDKVDIVSKVKLLGGDGLVYPYLSEYIEYIMSKYRNRIETLRIGTNGTIIPSDSLLDLCKKYNVIFDISDYVEAIQGKSKMDEILRIFDEKNIRYDIKRTGEQWLDMGFPDNKPAWKSDIEVEEHFHKCAMFCRNFYEGKLWYCCSNFAAVHAKLFEENENDYIDFMNEKTKEEILAFELGYTQLGFLTFCRVCRGCSIEANSMMTEVAKQI